MLLSAVVFGGLGGARWVGGSCGPAGVVAAMTVGANQGRTRDHYASPAKVVMLGDPFVGKTRLCHAIVGDMPFDKAYKPTLGADFAHTELVGSSGEPTRIHLWDTAGQEHFRSIIPQFMTGADLALVCYDVSELNTMTGITEWISFARGSRAGPDVQVILVGCKADKPSVVAIETIEKLRDDNGLAGIAITSAVSLEGVADLQRQIADVAMAARTHIVSCSERMVGADGDGRSCGC